MILKFMGVRDAKAKLSELVERARRGERVVVTHHGQPVALLGPFNAERLEDLLTSEDEELARGIAEARASGVRVSSAEARRRLGVPPRARRGKRL